RGGRRGPGAALLIRPRDAACRHLVLARVPASPGGGDNRRMIREITPRDASYRLAQGAVLVDVREEHERELGMAQGALGVARADLEAAPHQHLPGPDADIMLICQSGGRSLLAAQQLQRLGYRRVVSVRGGTLMWHAEGLPLTRPTGTVDEDFHERYSRH